MSLPVDVPRPAVLWKSLPESRRLEAAVAFFEDEQSFAEQAEAIGLIARQINFRPKSVLVLPAQKKARHLVRLARLPDAVVGRVLVAYHLSKQRPMMGAFLDALGIAHEDGLISEEHVSPPEREKLLAAAAHLQESHSPDDVRLYFTTLLMQDPDTWGLLRDVVPGTEGSQG